MNVLVDTSIWSLVVRQELLSGVKVKAQFDLLRDHLRSFPDLQLESADYEEAATAFNRS